MPQDEKKKVVLTYDRDVPKPWRSKDMSGPTIAEKEKMMVKKIVTNIPKRTWRDDSRGMTFHHEVDRFAKKTKENFITLIITVVGMATALTWNEVVKYMIDLFFADRSALYAKLYVAVIATVFTLTVTYMISRIRDKDLK